MPWEIRINSEQCPDKDATGRCLQEWDMAVCKENSCPRKCHSDLGV
jgi:hypothetical protein